MDSAGAAGLYLEYVYNPQIFVPPVTERNHILLSFSLATADGPFITETRQHNLYHEISHVGTGRPVTSQK